MRTVRRKVLATTGVAAMVLAGLVACGSKSGSNTPAAAKNTKVGSDLIQGSNSAGFEWVVTGAVLLLAAGFDAVVRRGRASEAAAAVR